MADQAEVAAGRNDDLAGARSGPAETNARPQISNKPNTQDAPEAFLPKTAVGITQLLANLAVIGALIVAGLTFWKQQQNIPRDEAALLVSSLTDERLSQARSILFRLWADKSLQQFELGVPTDFKESLVRKTIETSAVPETDIIEAIVNLANYYDEVEICVEKGRCDREEINENLGRYSVAFYCLYRSEIEDVRQRLVLTGLGDGLARFVDRQGGC